MKDIKTRCFKHPQKRLWVGPTKNVQNLEAIFAHIDSLDYADEPDYDHIRDHLIELYNRYEMVQLPLPTQLAPINAGQGITPSLPAQKVWALITKSAEQIQDLQQVRLHLDMTRENDFMEYFRDPKGYTASTNNQGLQP